MHTRFEALWVPVAGQGVMLPSEKNGREEQNRPETFLPSGESGREEQFGDLEAENRAAAEKIEAEVRRLEGVFNRFDAKSAVAALNRSREKAKVEDEDLWFLLEFCEQMRAATQGHFDIAALSSGRTGEARFTLYHPSHEIKLSKGCVMDFGGIAKGYALEKVRKILCEENGVESALLNFGGSSVLGIGHHPLGPCWKVDEFELCDSALSISGRSRDGRNHIINPRTGRAPSREGDIAVQGRSALVCEALSTALYAAEPEVRNEIIANFEGYTVTEYER
ncbi:MAG: FAD:protein FMN transferase [Bacteroidales bacterium]|nr:FAD:protein FMN transferase [Bacteroidales bacterium]